jgi:hypothetical protein
MAAGNLTVYPGGRATPLGSSQWHSIAGLLGTFFPTFPNHHQKRLKKP